ncbi:MAG: hypothetical protein JWO33_162 [Caulobacteraceae bacterium]|nr:hypothetical protein [Caulobacteraceae bacterium]
MRLHLHPDSRCDAVDSIVVEAGRAEQGLSLRYRLTGDLAALVLPEPARPERADELWRHTCFEAFVAGEGAAYREFNFAPSREWAAYEFDGYRQGMRPAAIDPPAIEGIRNAGALQLVTRIEVSSGPLSLGLSAVVEERGGRISYWALAHPPGKPDFHSPDCFALRLPAVERS